MNLVKKLSAVFLMIAVMATAFSFAPSTLKANADEGMTLTVYAGGVNYMEKNYTENNATIDVAGGTTVVIGYYALNSGWKIFGLETLTASGTGTDLVYKTTVGCNYKVTLDTANGVVYFRRTYVTAHTHKMTWGQIQMPTYNRPEVDTYFCTDCYYVESTRVASQATYDSIYHPTSTVTTIKAALTNATPGSSKTIELGKINNVTAADMNIIKNSNVNVTLKYTSNGKNYTVVIPAGKCVTSPTIEFYGPEFLRVAYNGTAQ